MSTFLTQVSSSGTGVRTSTYHLNPHLISVTLQSLTNKNWNGPREEPSPDVSLTTHGTPTGLKRLRDKEMDVTFSEHTLDGTGKVKTHVHQNNHFC